MHNFTKRYNRNMLLTMVVLLIISTALLSLHIYSNSRQEILQRIDTFKSKSIALDNLIGDIIKHLHMLQLSAESYYIVERTSSSPLFDALSATPHSPSYYSLDSFLPPFKAKNIGNLTGRGDVSQLSMGIKKEILMALSLNPLFQATASNIPGAAWVYYTSKNNFINIYPWEHSTNFKYTDDLYTHEFYKWGLPENNPDRQLFWTPAYIDEFGKGLMVSAAEPVYHDDEFLGTVAIDLTLKSIAESISSAEGSSILLVNKQNQLLVDSSSSKKEIKQVSNIKEVLPEALYQHLDLFFAAPALSQSHYGDHYSTYYQMENAPWKMILLINQRDIWINSLTTIGIVFLTLIAALVGMMLITNRMTFKEFINPADRLVRHISRENQNEVAEIPDVPEVWLPWFKTISATFEANRRHTSNLESLVEQRTQALELEKTKSDKLLLNILPKSIADRLKGGEEQISDHYADVSVLFADIVGFTQLSEKVDANLLVETLNRIFSSFDSITEEFGLEKIKTIGDSYMLAGGIPLPNSTHLRQTLNAGIRMLSALEEIQKESDYKLEVRIGIHTGPLVAGVIGRSKFIYDMWGDTVNIASRMESSGMTGRIQVSERVYQKMNQYFVFEKREPIQIKGKGMMQSYLLAENQQA